MFRLEASEVRFFLPIITIRIQLPLVYFKVRCGLLHDLFFLLAAGLRMLMMRRDQHRVAVVVMVTV